MKIVLRFFAALVVALASGAAFAQESVSVSQNWFHLGPDTPSTPFHTIQFVFTFNEDPNEPNPSNHTFNVYKNPSLGFLTEANSSTPAISFSLGPSYGYSATFTYDYQYPPVTGYFTGDIYIEDAGEPLLNADVMYDLTVIPPIGISDYIQFINSVGANPSTFSPTTGSPIPPGCPLAFCPILFSAKFYDFDASGTIATHWTWTIDLYHANGAYSLPLPPSSDSSAYSDLGIYSTFTLPNFDWRRDANGDIFAVVTVTALDSDGFRHRTQAIVGVTYPPAPMTGKLVCPSGVPVAHSTVTLAFSDSSGVLDTEAATTDGAGDFTVTLQCDGTNHTNEKLTVSVPGCNINRVVPLNRCHGDLGNIFCAACAQSTTNSLPLDTGYNHAALAPYPAVTTAVSSMRDNYWIAIAAYPPRPVPASAFVLQPHPAWLPSLPSSNWVGARNTTASDASTNTNNPSYAILRKCFCLASGVNAPQISFQARADDTLQVWLNSQFNVLLPPQFGSFHGAPLSSLPSTPGMFHAGLNCLYALVEDTYGGAVGFDLDGFVQVNGPAPQPVAGPNLTAACGGGLPPLIPITSETEEERKIVDALVKKAEDRRLARGRR